MPDATQAQGDGYSTGKPGRRGKTSRLDLFGRTRMNTRCRGRRRGRGVSASLCGVSWGKWLEGFSTATCEGQTIRAPVRHIHGRRRSRPTNPVCPELPINVDIITRAGACPAHSRLLNVGRQYCRRKTSPAIGASESFSAQHRERRSVVEQATSSFICSGWSGPVSDGEIKRIMRFERNA